MKRSTNIRYKNSWIDFQGDGRFSKERIKGKDKKLLGKWSRNKIYKQIEDSYRENEEIFNEIILGGN